MKNILLYLLCFALLAFMGCRQSNASSPKYNIVIIPRSLNKTFHPTLVKGAIEEARTRNVELQVFAPPSARDYQYQKEAIREISSRNDLHGVLLTPNHSGALFDELKQLDDKKIPFVIVDSPMDFAGRESEFNYYCGYVGTDNRYGGKIAAEYIAKELAGGELLLIRGVETHQSSIDREAGFLNTMNKYPHFSVSGVISGRWDRDPTIKALEKLPESQLIDIDAVFACNDSMALGAATYFSRYAKRPLIVGYDGLLNAQRAIVNGSMDATVVQTPYAMGQTAVMRLVECIDDDAYSQNSTLTKVALIKAARTLTSEFDYKHGE